MTWWEELRGSGPWFLAFLGILGAVAGSFASAAIYRLPREDRSLLRPLRSFCPACGYQLRWFDNLPVLSYLILAGRCRSCRRPIGVSYLLNELVLAVLFILAGLCWPGDQEGPLALGFVLVAITALWIATVIDWKYLILPDPITLGGIPFGLLAAFLVPEFHFQEHGPGDWVPFPLELLGVDPALGRPTLALVSGLVGGGLAWLFMFVLRVLFQYLLGQEALGLGDVKFLAAVGALVGVQGAAWTLLVGVFVGAVMGLLNALVRILMIARQRRARGHGFSWSLATALGWRQGRRIPFGPYLVLGTILVLLIPVEINKFFLETWPKLMQGLL